MRQSLPLAHVVWMQHTKLFPAGLTRGRWVMDDSPNGCDSSQGAWLDITMVFFLRFYFTDFGFLPLVLLFFLGASSIILFFLFFSVSIY
jgi:hypothetical protein